MKRKLMALATLGLVATGLTSLIAAPAYADGTSHGKFASRAHRNAYFQMQKRQQSMINQYNNDQYLLQQQMQRNPYLYNPYYSNPYNGYYYNKRNRILDWIY